jgi:hypothetical protein
MLPFKYTVVKGRDPMLLGSGPVNSLSLILKLCNDDATPSVVGIVPFKELKEPSKYASEVISPIDEGREPDILLDVKMKDTKPVNTPNDVGRVPVSSLFDTSNKYIFVSLSIPIGNGPVK